MGTALQWTYCIVVCLVTCRKQDSASGGSVRSHAASRHRARTAPRGGRAAAASLPPVPPGGAEHVSRKHRTIWRLSLSCVVFPPRLRQLQSKVQPWHPLRLTLLRPAPLPSSTPTTRRPAGKLPPSSPCGSSWRRRCWRSLLPSRLRQRWTSCQARLITNLFT